MNWSSAGVANSGCPVLSKGTPLAPRLEIWDTQDMLQMMDVPFRANAGHRESLLARGGNGGVLDDQGKSAGATLVERRRKGATTCLWVRGEVANHQGTSVSVCLRRIVAGKRIAVYHAQGVLSC